jgi:hypothetical protein
LIKNKILRKFSLEQCKDGIYFLDNLPLFFNAINVAKQLQVEVWLESPNQKDNYKDYIR